MMKRNPPVRQPAAPINYPTLPKSKPATKTGKSPRRKKLKDKGGSEGRKEKEKEIEKEKEKERIFADTTRSILDTLSGDSTAEPEVRGLASPSPSKSPAPAKSNRTSAETLSTLSTLIKQTLEEWSAEISSAGEGDALSDSGHQRDYFLKMSNLHLTDGQYSNKHGAGSLAEEFGDFKITKPRTIVESENTLSAQVTSLNNSSSEISKAIKSLRAAIRSHAASPSSETEKDLSSLLSSTKAVLSKAANLRKEGRRSTDIIRESMKLSMSFVSDGVTLKRGKNENDEDEDEGGGSELESSSENEEEEQMLAEEEGMSPMASPRRIILTAQRESRVERRKTRASIRENQMKIKQDIRDGKREAEKPAPKRRIVPFHLKQDNLANISWFTNLSGSIASSTVLRSVSTMGDLQREIVLERSRKKESAKKGEYQRARKKSIALVQEVHMTTAAQEKLAEEKKGLQKELNISIKRYTVANKLLGEGEKNFKEKEHVWQGRLEEMEDEKTSIQRIMTERNEAMQGTYEAKMEVLSSSLEREKERLEKLISSVNGSKEKMRKVKEELAGERERRKAAEADRESLAKELETAENSMRDTKEELQAAVRAEAAKGSAFQSELAALKEEVKIKSDEYLNSVEEVQRLKGEVERLGRLGTSKLKQDDEEEEKKEGVGDLHREASAKFVEGVLREASPTR